VRAKKKRNKTHEESYIVLEVGGRRWGGSHGLTPPTSVGLSPEEEKIILIIIIIFYFIFIFFAGRR
jgi:hypothetical protein